MTASAGSGARAAALGRRGRRGRRLGSVEADGRGRRGRGRGGGGRAGDGDAADEHALTTSAKSAVRAMYRCFLMLRSCSFRSWLASVARWLRRWTASRLLDVAHLLPSIAGSDPGIGPWRRSTTAPHAPASASGGSSSTMSGGSCSRASADAARSRSSSRWIGRSNVSPAWLTPPPSDDTLDVVGHDQQVDRPGQPAADGVGDLDGQRRRRAARSRRALTTSVGRARIEGAPHGRPRWPGGVRLRARRAIAGPETRASRQPCWPQAQRGAVAARRWRGRSRRRGRARRDGAGRRG